MRELKFKAYHKTRKIILPVIKIKWFGENMFEVTVKEPEHGGEYLWLYHEIELMEYLGEKDKNGNEVYSADILEDSSGEIEVVKCAEGWTDEEIRWIGYGTFDKISNYSVVGNIYQNPELLK